MKEKLFVVTMWFPFNLRGFHFVLIFGLHIFEL